MARPGKAGLSLTLYQPFMAGPPFMKPQGHAAGSVCGLARDTHRVDANGVGKDVWLMCEVRADRGAMDFRTTDSLAEMPRRGEL